MTLNFKSPLFERKKKFPNIFFFLIVNLQWTNRTDLSKILEIELKCNGYVEDSVYSPGVESVRKYYNCLILRKSFNFSDYLLMCKMRGIDWLSRSNILCFCDMWCTGEINCFFKNTKINLNKWVKSTTKENMIHQCSASAQKGKWQSQ